MNEDKIFLNALSRYRRFGYILFFVMLILGVVGLIYWQWYALPIAIALGLIIGQIYAKIFYRHLANQTGYDIHTVRIKMMEADSKRKGLL